MSAHDIPTHNGIPVPQPTPPSARANKGYTLDPLGPLHRLFVKRMEEGRDLKIIITALNSQTGTGKSTLGFYLAHQWNPIYTGQEWTADANATLNVNEFKNLYREQPTGSVLIMDEAEQLDARRHMSSDNVDFSQDWMQMRVRQVCSILTLPTVTALDSRLEELADVWINVTRRGAALVHGIKVQSYGSRGVMTKKEHRIEWPNVAKHPEMKALDKMKERHIDDQQEEEEIPDPDEIVRENTIRIAQRMRNLGCYSQRDIADAVEKSQTWVSQNTISPETQMAEA